jgi:hypothetical protein
MRAGVVRAVPAAQGEIARLDAVVNERDAAGHGMARIVTTRRRSVTWR